MVTTIYIYIYIYIYILVVAMLQFSILLQVYHCHKSSAVQTGAYPSPISGGLQQHNAETSDINISPLVSTISVPINK
jgi:hypothetical protein